MNDPLRNKFHSLWNRLFLVFRTSFLTFCRSNNSSELNGRVDVKQVHYDSQDTSSSLKMSFSFVFVFFSSFFLDPAFLFLFFLLSHNTKIQTNNKTPQI